MIDQAAILPRAEVRGEGTIRYRCADCGEMMDPDEAVIRDGLSYHAEHEETDDGR